ncbi:hypothetical protein C8J57DRAFT_1480718 [Mycena rebaudengoi]|nr:hypothetical protein C8J57DRAFT_1480718 [Mycena rebaudengoi]
MFLHAIKIKPLNGRDGRFSTGRSTANPYRDRAVEVEGKWLTERARHPFDGCRGTVATVTGGSPRPKRYFLIYELIIIKVIWLPERSQTHMSIPSSTKGRPWVDQCDPM